MAPPSKRQTQTLEGQGVLQDKGQETILQDSVSKALSRDVLSITATIEQLNRTAKHVDAIFSESVGTMKAIQDYVNALLELPEGHSFETAKMLTLIKETSHSWETLTPAYTPAMQDRAISCLRAQAVLEVVLSNEAFTDALLALHMACRSSPFDAANIPEVQAVQGLALPLQTVELRSLQNMKKTVESHYEGLQGFIAELHKAVQIASTHKDEKTEHLKDEDHKAIAGGPQAVVAQVNKIWSAAFDENNLLNTNRIGFLKYMSRFQLLATYSLSQSFTAIREEASKIKLG